MPQFGALQSAVYVLPDNISKAALKDICSPDAIPLLREDTCAVLCCRVRSRLVQLTLMQHCCLLPLQVGERLKLQQTPICGTCLTFWAGIKALLWSQTHSLCNVRGSTLLYHSPRKSSQWFLVGSWLGRYGVLKLLCHGWMSDVVAQEGFLYLGHCGRRHWHMQGWINNMDPCTCDHLSHAAISAAFLGCCPDGLVTSLTLM